jgi:hypothetical protein
MFQVMRRRQRHARHVGLATAQGAETKTQHGQASQRPATRRFHDPGSPLKAGRLHWTQPNGARGAKLTRSACEFKSVAEREEFTGSGEWIEQDRESQETTHLFGSVRSRIL